MAIKSVQTSFIIQITIPYDGTDHKQPILEHVIDLEITLGFISKRIIYDVSFLKRGSRNIHYDSRGKYNILCG